MAMMRYGPAIRVTATAVLTDPSTGVNIYPVGTGMFTGTLNYKFRACLDGGGLFHTATVAKSITLTTRASVTLEWSAYAAANPGARWFEVYKEVAAAPGTYRLIYSGGDLACSDIAQSGTTGNMTDWALGTDTNTTSSPGTYTFDLRPDGAFAHTIDTAAGNGFNQVTSCQLEYQDFAEPGSMISVNRKVIAKEFGVRPVVSLRMSYKPGTDEDLAARQIYGCKLAWPDSSAIPGVRLELSLNYGGSTPGSSNWTNPVFREARIEGNFSNAPESGPNVRIAQEWRFLGTNPLKSVPWAGEIYRGRGAW